MSCRTFMKDLLVEFIEYKTPKIVHIKNKKVGVLNRLIQFAIIVYVAVYAITIQKGYQLVSPIESSATIKLKGVIDTSQIQGFKEGIDPRLYQRVWDVSDYVVPPSESNAFFVITNIVITPNQKRTTCGEHPTADRTAICDPNNNTCNLTKGEYSRDNSDDFSLLGSGVRTGRCVKFSWPAMNVTHTCEIMGWCPAERDETPLVNGSAILKDTKKLTVLIKNNIKFTLYNVSRRNIPDTSNQTYLQGCNYHPHTDPFCPVFRLEDIINITHQNYDQIAKKGGIIAIEIHWDCNLDFNAEKCTPAYSFRRLDNPDAQIATGWNFRYSNFYGDNKRTQYKVYGIRFVILVTGQGGKFNLMPTLIAIGSGLGLMAITTIICDIVVLYLTKNKDYYSDKKFLYVNDDSIDDDTTRICPDTRNLKRLHPSGNELFRND